MINFLCTKFGNHGDREILEHGVNHERVRVENQKFVSRRSVEDKLTLSKDNARGQRNAFGVVEAQLGGCDGLQRSCHPNAGDLSDGSDAREDDGGLWFWVQWIVAVLEGLKRRKKCKTSRKETKQRTN